MFTRRISTWFAILTLAGVCLTAPLIRAAGEEHPIVAAEKQETPQKSTKEIKNQLRGKLLYRKNQARKLEKAAEENSPELRKEIRELNRKIREAYIKAEPKLEAIYKLQDELQAQLDKLGR